MLSEYEAAMLTRHKSAGGDPRPGRAVKRNRIGVALVALSLLSALALLYSAWFDWTPGPRATRTVATPAVAGPMVHPTASGLPEAALFLRQRPSEGDA